MWVAGIQVREPSPVATQGLHKQEAEIGSGARTLGTPGVVLTPVPTVCPHKDHLGGEQGSQSVRVVPASRRDETGILILPALASRDLVRQAVARGTADLSLVCSRWTLQGL